MVTLPLALGLVAAAARRAGHDVTFLDLLNERDPDAAVRRGVQAALAYLGADPGVSGDGEATFPAVLEPTRSPPAPSRS